MYIHKSVHVHVQGTVQMAQYRNARTLLKIVMLVSFRYKHRHVLYACVYMKYTSITARIYMSNL